MENLLIFLAVLYTIGPPKDSKSEALMCIEELHKILDLGFWGVKLSHLKSKPDGKNVSYLACFGDFK